MNSSDNSIIPSNIHELGASFVLDSLRLAIHLDVFLLLVFLTIAAVNSPRAFARLRTTSEWGQGLFFRSARLQPRRLGRRPSERSGQSTEISNGDSMRGDKRIYQPAHPIQEKPMPSIPASYPPHAPSCPVLLHRISLALERRIAPGQPLNRVALLWAYVGVLTYASFYKSNPAVDPVRTGFISISQLPFVFALATKNNALGLLLGKGYEKASPAFTFNFFCHSSIKGFPS
jgi:ferric-chelate reductase